MLCWKRYLEVLPIIPLFCIMTIRLKLCGCQMSRFCCLRLSYWGTIRMMNCLHNYVICELPIWLSISELHEFIQITVKVCVLSMVEKPLTGFPKIFFIWILNISWSAPWKTTAPRAGFFFNCIFRLFGLLVISYLFLCFEIFSFALPSFSNVLEHLHHSKLSSEVWSVHTNCGVRTTV